MAHFAELDDKGIVLRVLVIDNSVLVADDVKNSYPSIWQMILEGKAVDITDPCFTAISGNKVEVYSTTEGKDVKVTWEDEQKGIDFLKNLFGEDTIWVQTSYNNNIRKQYAGIGFTYDGVNNVFIRPSPYPSWVLDTNFDWQAPDPYPNDGNHYKWDEGEQKWVIVYFPSMSPSASPSKNEEIG